MTRERKGQHARILEKLREIRARITQVEEQGIAVAQARESLSASERKYRDLYDNAPDMFLSVDVETSCIVDCNETLARAVGREKVDLLGRPALELYVSESHQAVEEVLRKLAETGESRAQLCLRCADDSRIEVAVYSSLIRDEEGRPLRSRCVLRDITEWTRSEARRRASEERFRALVNNAYDLIAELDEQGCYTYLSPNTETTLGWNIRDLMGTNVMDHVHDDDLERAQAGFLTLLDEHHVQQNEYRYRHKDGSWRWLVTTAGVYTASSGDLRILAVSRDVSERRRTLEERESALREKEEALAQVKLLSGLLPICTLCRKVRDDAGYWQNLESYVCDHTNAVFSHSLCETCLKRHYAYLFEDEK